MVQNDFGEEHEERKDREEEIFGIDVKKPYPDNSFSKQGAHMKSWLPVLRRSSAGLTLVETLLATSILGFVCLAFLSAFITSRHTAAMASSQMAGTQLARQEMERLLVNKFTYPAMSLGTHTISSGFYTVTQDPADPAIKEISLTVRWTEPHSTLTSTVTLVTCISTNLHT